MTQILARFWKGNQLHDFYQFTLSWISLLSGGLTGQNNLPSKVGIVIPDSKLSDSSGSCITNQPTCGSGVSVTEFKQIFPLSQAVVIAVAVRLFCFQNPAACPWEESWPEVELVRSAGLLHGT